MKRKELKILGLSYSQSQIGSYVVVLSEKKGRRKLPLIIKPSDAQRIALEIEGIKPTKPMTHDLIKNIGDIMGYDIQEVYIHTLAEGVFYTKFVVNNGIEEFEIECGAGDGLALAVLYKCPIYVNVNILDSAGIYINDDGTAMTEQESKEYELESDEVEDFEDEDDIDTPADRIVSVEDLEIMMQQAIENEEYEIAAELRDRIQMLKK
jgi:bifunctional DNase/RNase